jgi:hypothetical protein
MTRARLRGAAIVAAAAIAAAAGLVQLVAHYRIFLDRAGFPLDLEWMEGGMLMHAYRLARGQTVYVAPSVDFIPFFYTPLYPALVALLSKLFGLGYVLGRVVSLLAFSGSLVLLALAAVRQARGADPAARAAAALVGLAAAGAVAAGYVMSGAFYDLARSDSLLLFLQAAALYVATERDGRRSAAAAGVLIALAFFTKQTAAIVGIAIGAGLLVTSWRRGLVYGVAAAATLGAGLWLLNATSDGWFWKYIFEGHQSHGFSRHLVFVVSPKRLFAHGWPTLAAAVAAVAGLALARGLGRRDAVLGAAGLAGFVSACVGMGTQWAFENAYIPAMYFPAYAAGVLGARLVARAGQARLARLAVPAAIAALALGAQNVAVERPDADKWVPGPGDRAAAARFLARLRALPGELFIPFHPFYAVLVGKRPYQHRMGWLDVGSMVGRPAGLDEAIASRRFAHVVLDYKYNDWELPGLAASYHVVHHFKEGQDAVRVFSGAPTSPSRLLAPTVPAPPLPPGALKIADFESGDWQTWTVDGEAFGVNPAPAQGGLFGRFAADSGHASPGATGALRSPPIVVDRARLRLHLRGTPAPGLRVLLLEGPETVHVATPRGDAPAAVEWDVTALAGRQVALVIEDRSTAGALAVDEIALYDPPPGAPPP